MAREPSDATKIRTLIAVFAASKVMQEESHSVAVKVKQEKMGFAVGLYIDSIVIKSVPYEHLPDAMCTAQLMLLEQVAKWHHSP